MYFETKKIPCYGDFKRMPLCWHLHTALTLRVWFLPTRPRGHGGWSLSDFWQLDPKDIGADFCLILSDFWQLVLEDMRAVIRRWDPILWRRPHCLPPANWSCYWSYQGVWNLVKPFQILTMLSVGSSTLWTKFEGLVGKKWSAIEIERRSAMVSVGIPKDIVFKKKN